MSNCTCNQNNNTTITTSCHVCQPICQTPEPCDCPVKDLSTDCIVFTGDLLECSEIEPGQTLTETIVLMDGHVCDVRDELIALITALTAIVNVGGEEEIYKGVTLLGARQLRTLKALGSLITVTQNTDTIDFSIDEDALTEFVNELIGTYSVSNVGTGADVYKNSTVVGANTQFNFRTLKSNGGSVTITEGTDEINFEVAPSGDTLIEAGINSVVTGTGVLGDPYIIDSTTQIVDGVTTIVTGDGLTTPYIIETVNLQKTIDTFPYTLLDGDDKYTIFVENGASNVVINVPDGLVDNFSAVFIQKGVGTVTIQDSGTATLLYPSTTLQNLIKGQYFWAMVEKELNTNTYYLLGSLLPV